MIARAFLWLMLNPMQKADLENFERRISPGTFIQGFEVCQKYKLNPKTLSDAQMGQMQKVAGMFSGILFARRKQMARADNPDFTDAEINNSISGKIESEDAMDWVRFAEKHYQEPPMQRRMISEFID